ADPLAEENVPELLAVQVETVNARFAKEHVQPFPIRGGSAGSVAVIGAFPRVLVLWQDRLEFLRPQDLAAVTGDAEDVPPQVVHVARLTRRHRVARVTGQEDAV